MRRISKEYLEMLTKKELENEFVRIFGEDRIDRRKKKKELVKQFLEEQESQLPEEEKRPRRQSLEHEEELLHEGKEYRLIKKHEQGFSDYKSKDGEGLSKW